MKLQIKQIALYFALSAFIVFGLSNCSAPEPRDLEGYKKELASKKSELSALNNEIKVLEEKIQDLSPEKVKKTALVKLQSMKKESKKRFVDFQASVMSDEIAQATSEIGGRIVSLSVKEGDYVKKGQLIASVDSEVFDSQLSELNTRYDLAKTVFEKQKRLWDQNIGSEMQYLQAKNNMEGLEKSIATLQTQMKKKNIYSPISGAVDREFLKPGEIAAPGMPIVTILNTHKLKVTADIPENYLSTVKKGDRVGIEFPALDKSIERRITMVGRTIDPTNRTFKIEMTTDHLKGMLKPNLLSKVMINDLTIEDAFFVPTELIQQEVSGKQYLYVAAKEGNQLMAQKAYVETGDAIDNIIEVKSGVKEGDNVVFEGARSISVGDILINESSK